MVWFGNMLSDINGRPFISPWYHTVIDCSCSSRIPVILCSILQCIQIYEKIIACAGFITVIMDNKLASLTCKVFIGDNVTFDLFQAAFIMFLST